jgi:maleylacetate reductase
MRNGTFVFPAIKRIVYGSPAADVLAAEAARMGTKRVFLVVSGTMHRTTDEVEKVRMALGARYAGCYADVPQFNPRPNLLQAADAARRADADLVISFGGGAVVECAKLLRLCLRHGVTEPDGLDRFRRIVEADGTRFDPVYEAPSIPLIVVPTTLSGGEFTPNAGSYDPRVKRKHSFWHPGLIPSVIVFDPAPTVHTPLWVWLSTGVRALDHATEGLCSMTGNPISDGLYRQALQLLSRALTAVKRDPTDLEARLDCLFGVWLAMAGRHGGVEMGASHAIGHVLGGSFGVPHGYTSCVMLPHVLRFNRSANAERQQWVSEALGHPGDDAANVVAELIASLGMPTRLADVGIGHDQFSEIALHAMHDRWLHTNPLPIRSPEQVLQILEAAA